MQTQTIHYIPPVAQTSGAIRVAAYARVSSDSSDQLESYAAQVQHYEQLIGRNPGWELVDIYADEGLTGTRADTRAEFQRLLKDCRRGRIDKVLTKSISRFSRNTRDTLTSIRELKALGVEVFFEKERIDTGGVTSEMLISFYGAAAQEESLSISSNMLWSYKRRMKSGEFITCSAPYGYELVKNQLIVDDCRAEVIRLIFESYLAGKGSTAIASDLSKYGVPAPRGSVKWQRTTVSNILANEKYIGEALLQKNYTSDEFPFIRRNNNGERTMYHVTNSHTPIIPREVFDKAAHIREQRGNQCNSTGNVNTYPFSHMISCGVCGHNFRRKACNGKVYWLCYNHFLDKDNCPIKQITESVFEQAFIRMYQKLRAHFHDILTPMLEQLSMLRQRAVFRQDRILEVDNEILNTGRQTMLLHRLYGAGHMEAAHYYEQTQNLNSQINTLRRERLRLVNDARDDDTVDQTTLLLDILGSGPEQMYFFEADLLRSIVRQIVIVGQQQARFELINGLEVMEKL